MDSEILISREGQQFGPYSVSQLEEHVAEGSITLDDLAWIGGDQAEWKPLRELIDIEVLDEGKPATEAASVPSKLEKATRSKSKKPIGEQLWRFIYRGAIALAILFAGICVVAVMMDDDESASRSSSEHVDSPSHERYKDRTGSGADAAQVDTKKSVQTRPKVEAAKPKLFGKPATDVRLLDIIESYESNPLAGDQQFKGERIRVTGIVKAVRKTPAGDGYFATIQPAKGLPLNSRKAVSVRTKDEQALASFEAGGVVTVSGNMTGLDLMEYPRIDDAIVERQASALKPIPGTVFDWTKDEKPELRFDEPTVERAAELYLISLNAQIKSGFMPDYGSMDHARLAEIVLIDEGARHSFFRIAMTGMRGSRPLLNYAFVVVEQNPDGSFPEENSEGHLIHAVAHCGPKPNIPQMITLKQTNGWTSQGGWPQ
ncbi:GYF domain-containing protein [Verrucomicrobiales bacterium BCK34]|nr:GYF domain-containing protein [Verrucomicrobiales bacterium BCK34]